METDRLRLSPIGPHLADELYRLHLDPGIARWYGDWTRAGSPRREIGWAVRETHWGNGYATEIGFIGLALARRTVRLLRDLPRRLI
ncbi:GNAT family N-acetyltransferase [Amycolatopsis sp. NPDC054798]